MRMIEYRFILIQMLKKNKLKILNLKVVFIPLEYLLVCNYIAPKKLISSEYARSYTFILSVMRPICNKKLLHIDYKTSLFLNHLAIRTICFF